MPANYSYGACLTYTNSKYELRSYLESRWRRQSRLAPYETFGFERLLAHPPHSNSSIFNLEFELQPLFLAQPGKSARTFCSR